MKTLAFIITRTLMALVAALKGMAFFGFAGAAIPEIMTVTSMIQSGNTQGIVYNMMRIGACVGLMIWVLVGLFTWELVAEETEHE